VKKFLFDLFPLLLFFVAYRFADIYIATAVAMAAAVGQIAYIRLTGKKIETMHWINLVVIVVFGGATLWLQNEAFIKWKPTVLYWLFGAILLGSQWLFGKNLLQKLLAGKVELSAAGWRGLSLSWAIFFVLAGAANLFVAFSGLFSEAAWVNFKVFGLMGLLIVFVIGQSMWLGKHMITEDTDQTNTASNTALATPADTPMEPKTNSNDQHT
jgi:intracellular septation protein